MLKNIRTSKSSLIHERLAAIGLSRAEHAEALAALSFAERIVDGFAAIFAATQRLRNRLFLRPNLGT